MHPLLSTLTALEAARATRRLKSGAGVISLGVSGGQWNFAINRLI